MKSQKLCVNLYDIFTIINKRLHLLSCLVKMNFLKCNAPTIMLETKGRITDEYERQS